MADINSTTRSRREKDSRSRSPRRKDSHNHKQRSRSPHRHHHRKHKKSVDTVSKELPYDSRELTKRDFDAFKPMFALYLDIQKGKVLEELEDLEARGRWKSFIGKWNRAELSEGWYDPSTFQKAVESAASGEVLQSIHQRPATPPQSKNKVEKASAQDREESDSDDSIGPALPGESTSRGRRVGPSRPNMDDIQLRREMNDEEGSHRRDDMKYARKQDRKEQKESLDELAPRADAGTRERQLEKKKEVNEKMKSFREKSPGAAEVPDTELMGGEDGIEGYKKQKESFERKKNEREVRRDEFLMARQVERDERMQEYRSKEEGTMDMLRALAKQNFG